VQTADQERMQRMLEGVHSLDEFVTRSPRAWAFNNAQVRLLGGDLHVPGREASPRLLERAKRNLEEYFAVVGLRERFEESVVLMRHAFGWDWPFIEHYNATHERPSIDAVSPATRELIAEHNALDLELYEFGRELFEQQLRRYGPTLEEDLERLGAASAVRAQSATNR
jgi:Galactose-3-O-sulfotransferase